MLQVNFLIVSDHLNKVWFHEAAEMFLVRKKVPQNWEKQSVIPRKKCMENWECAKVPILTVFTFKETDSDHLFLYLVIFWNSTSEQFTSQQVAIVFEKGQVQVTEELNVFILHFQLHRRIPVDNLQIVYVLFVKPIHILRYWFYWFKYAKVQIVLTEHKWNVHWVPLAKYKDEKEIVRCKRVLIVTELFKITDNGFGPKESACRNRVFVITIFVTSRTRCIAHITLRFDTSR